MDDFNTDMSNSIHTVVHFNKKSSHLCLRLRAKSYTIYVKEVGCCIFHLTCTFTTECLIDEKQ